MDQNKKFLMESKERIKLYKKDIELLSTANKFMEQLNYAQYCFNFTWLGRPVIQLPQDLHALQELIWKVKPDLIIETGIAHGGSLIFYASMLELLGGDGEVLGIDIDIRAHNRQAIENHPMFKRITLFEGDSISKEMAAKVNAFAKGKKRVLVCLDSNHTHMHVLCELEIYSPLVTLGSYCVVFDTGIEDLPDDLFLDRPWGKGNNPKTAVWEFLKHHSEFVIDKEIELKLLITAASDGWLKRVK
jgi:cephalosporin hydroxylase